MIDAQALFHACEVHAVRAPAPTAVSTGVFQNRIDLA